MPANLENSAVAKGLERSVFVPIPKKGSAKECSNYHTIVLISHASKVMEKAMATHSSVLAWRIPGMGEPRGLPSMAIAQSRIWLSNLAAAAVHASKVMLKILEDRLHSMWTENFHIFKLDLEKAEELGIKLRTSGES